MHVHVHVHMYYATASCNCKIFNVLVMIFDILELQKILLKGIVKYVKSVKV